MRIFSLIALCLGSLLCQGVAFADEWLPPKAETYYSANRQWRLKVLPRAIESPLAYFTDKVKGRSNPGAPPRDSESSARGFMEHLSGKTWNLVWNAPLANETSPVSALVSNQGITATFDNWGSMGFGNDVVVIYDTRGRKVRSLALSDFLPKDYIHALPRSVSSIWWSGNHHFSRDGKQLILRVLVPTDPNAKPATEKKTYVDVTVDTTTGEVTPPQGAMWRRAVRAAAVVDAKLRAEEATEIAFLNSPLRAPATNNVTPWYRYLVEAFFRVDPDRADSYPETNVLPRREDPAYAKLLGYLKDTLAKPIDDGGAIMLASPDQANLVRAIDQITAKLPPGRLPKARIYVTVTPALQEAAARAIARTSATFIPLDVTKTIPPRHRSSPNHSGNH